MDGVLRNWITAIIRENQQVIRIAVRQRAKFEGWLKFELGAVAETDGATSVEVETSQDSNPQRADISLVYDGIHYDVELKTPNTNWRMPGVLSRTRPITNNVAGIIEDARKLQRSSSHGIVAFVMFPIPPQDKKWLTYLSRIARDLELPLTQESNCHIVSVSLAGNNSADLVVCTFAVDKGS